MSAWLDPLRAALDEATAPVTFFFRDDDAGWADAELVALLDVFAARDVPLDAAAIPLAVRDGLVAELVARCEAGTGLAVHQHGYAHLDHELGAGRRCEFGPHRARADQLADLAHGQAILREQFGPLLQPIFTPPWNRCTAATGDCLVELGVAALSRDRSAGRLDLRGLAELPICVDWLKTVKPTGRRRTRAELGEVLAERAWEGAPVGVMLHHAVMDAADRGGVDELLALLANHPGARCRSMTALLALSPEETPA